MVKHHSSNSKSNSKSNNNKAYYILCILILVVLVIYIVNKNTELFIDSTYGMPVSDMHFISDNNKKLIDVPVFNYKLMVIKSNIKNNTKTTTTQPQPTQTQPTQSQPIITEQPQPTNMPSQTTKYSNVQQLETFINTNTTSKNNNNNNNNTQEQEQAQAQAQAQEQEQAQEHIKLLLPEKNQLKYLSVFQHKPFDKYKGIGQTVILTDEPFTNMSSAIDSVRDRKCLNYLTSSPVMPQGFTLVWTSDLNADNNIFSVWTPNAPSGYVCLGDIIVMGVESPPLDICACYPLSLVEKSALSNGILWSAINDMGKLCYCWGVGTLATFKTSNQYNGNIPELQNVYNLSSSSLKRNLLGSDKTESGQNNTNTNTTYIPSIPSIPNTSNTSYKKNIGGVTL